MIIPKKSPNRHSCHRKWTLVDNKHNPMAINFNSKNNSAPSNWCLIRDNQHRNIHSRHISNSKRRRRAARWTTLHWAILRMWILCYSLIQKVEAAPQIKMEGALALCKTMPMDHRLKFFLATSPLPHFISRPHNNKWTWCALNWLLLSRIVEMRL